jgi:hypothetical protein
VHACRLTPSGARTVSPNQTGAGGVFFPDVDDSDKRETGASRPGGGGD